METTSSEDFGAAMGQAAATGKTGALALVNKGFPADPVMSV
jgi:hypothetical protein